MSSARSVSSSSVAHAPPPRYHTVVNTHSSPTALLRGKGGGFTWSVGDGMSVGIDTGCSLAVLDARFARCSSCPLPRCWLDFTKVERARAAALVRQLGGVPPRM